MVLSRCLKNIEPDGIAEGFRLYERLRRARTARMQVTAREHTWMRFKTDAEWVYGYDAWTTPLNADPEPVASSSAFGNRGTPSFLPDAR